MTSQELFHSIEHRGCGIRAASYSVGPKAWLPEACVSLETETGLRRIWVHSFAHCFDAEKLTFPNKLDADGWALVAARTIIDRALEQLSPPKRRFSPGHLRASLCSRSAASKRRYCRGNRAHSVHLSLTCS
jgi:hypothetical protein